MAEDDFDGFIEEREKTISNHIASLVGAGEARVSSTN
jgi:hypothetical protein